MIAARLLADEGVEPAIAMAQVRRARPGDIETSEQEDWVKQGVSVPLSEKPAGRTIDSRKNGEAIARRSLSSPMPSTAGSPRDLALGAFIGLAVGDALGTTIEFSRRDTYPLVVDMVAGGPIGLKAGEWTDDTSMALCLADSLIASGGQVEATDLDGRFLRWYREGESSVTGWCFDIGITTRWALESFRRTGSPVGDRSAQAAGNGGIMRLAPVAIVAGSDPDQSAALS